MKHQISLHTIHAGYKYAALAEALYTSAFPEIEQRPIEDLYRCTLKNRCFWYAVLDGTTFIGMAYVVLYRKIAYILYLAVDEKKRNKQYGSDILAMLKEMYRDKKLVLFIESLDEKCDNYDMRVRRKAFYLRNGFYDTLLNQDCETDLGHCTYEILSTDPNLSEKEFATFTRHYPMTSSITVLHKR